MNPHKKRAIELLRQATAELESATTAITKLIPPRNGETPQDETQKIENLGRLATREATEALVEANERLLAHLFGLDRE